MYHYTALVTVLALMLFFYMAVRVAQARARFGVKAPAVTGNADFERTYRVQVNTLEWLPIFLPALWLFAIYVSDVIAALIGLVWIAGRAMYMVSYAKAAEKRGLGFGVQALAALALLVGSLIAIVWRLLHG
ncbi:MAPEG family protein (Membrane-associated protein in eicosanoid and glutathione metabolism) [Bradyrhizobium sp. ORS 285]|uniref:MAPEG family protein n=1 Tax=Bradyrhizobium sp. ORS 285 TaxID=115808 RepID=UPI0002405CED|nr:MAPEG family protein [Bradyrhizobium sp. ORS 285]CCD90074.1 MAPEG family protein (Membrane-associated protein in eicosanoid and glutathione metabolism) [Bradyrhizobium sp. ORS 285]SMX61639.1 MAPEG family protein (Membrane-associated protein in eicosanoid and glutathione metabolism) [Bradyrhizobium sp. ORS 285]